MRKLLPLLAVALLALPVSAHATVLTIGLGLTSGDFTVTSGGTALNPNVDLLSNPNLTLDHNAEIINPPSTLVNYYVQPTGTLYGANGGSFLSVYGQSGPDFTFDPGIATLSISGQHTIGFTWGTVDDYNILTLTDSRGNVYNIGGADVLASLVNPVPGTTQTDVQIVDPFGTITSAVFQSFQNSFEVANFEESANAPLPASLPLFGAGLLLLALVGYRKQKTA